jgi:hypothetical protein
MEVHDFNPPPPSSNLDDDDGRPSSEDTSKEEYLGYEPGPSFLWPWPRVHMFMIDAGPSSDPWLALLATDEGAMWPTVASCRSHRRGRHRAHGCRLASAAQPTFTAHLPDLTSVQPPIGWQGMHCGP